MMAGPLINLVPISALLLASLILREPVSVSLLPGAALVVSGIYLTIASDIRK
jgi:drug/metabolite transporter (DMT)-like permease